MPIDAIRFSHTAIFLDLLRRQPARRGRGLGGLEPSIDCFEGLISHVGRHAPPRRVSVPAPAIAFVTLMGLQAAHAAGRWRLQDGKRPVGRARVPNKKENTQLWTITARQLP